MVWAMCYISTLWVEIEWSLCASRSLKPSEKNYPAHKLEFLALKWAVCEKIHDSLYGSLFEVITDNNPLTYVFTTAKLDAIGQRWVASLSGYIFTVKYRSGKNNADTDGLSRRQEAETEPFFLKHGRRFPFLHQLWSRSVHLWKVWLLQILQHQHRRLQMPFLSNCFKHMAFHPKNGEKHNWQNQPWGLLSVTSSREPDYLTNILLIHRLIDVIWKIGSNSPFLRESYIERQR